MSVNVCYLSRRQKNIQGNSDTIKVTVPTAVGTRTGVKAAATSVWQGGPAQPQGWGHPTETRGWQPPQWLWRAEHRTKVWRELFQSLQSNTDWHNMFWAGPGQSPHLSSLVLPFGMRLPILCSSTTVSWKHVTHLVSQVHSRRGILPYDESYLKVHPYLI